jgi:hypothetical protein
LSNAAIGAAWPAWWSDEADNSSSARAELSFSVARRLGLDPESLLADEQPRFLWREEARFKHATDETELERAGITSFGRSVTAILLRATPPAEHRLAGMSAVDLRDQVLGSGRPFVGLLDLLTLAWTLGVPTIHLRVFPWERKRMAAMSASIGEGSAILLGKDASYPAPIAFYLAHEMGHVALEHLDRNHLIVDLEEDGQAPADDEERAADEFALELLTGRKRPVVLGESGRGPGRELARVAIAAGEELQIEPGMLAQLYGHSSGDWAIVNTALPRIYGGPTAVWEVVNGVAERELDVAELSVEAVDFLHLVLGATQT